MKEKKIVEAIGEVNDKYIGEAVNYKSKKKLIFGACASVVAVAACLVMILGTGMFKKNTVADSVVSIDINPSIELTISKDDKIVSAVALNADAEVVLAGMKLENVDLDTGLNAIIGSLLKNGYLDQVYNAVNVCVENDDEERANELGNKVTEEISNLFDDNDLIGGVNTQYCTTDKELKELADSYGISVGKLCLAQKVSENTGMSLDLAVLLSISELWDLMDAVDVTLISKEEALAIAIADANVSKEDITLLANIIQERAGVYSFDIVFTVGEYEMYKYEIDAITGTILEREYEVVVEDGNEDVEDETENESETSGEEETSGETEEETKEPPKPVKQITKKEALEIAYADAGVDAKEVKLDELKHMPKEKQYYIEFAAGTCIYEYVINAVDGSIISKEIEDKSEILEGEEIAPESLISADEALQIVLDKAGVTVEQLDKYDIKFTNKKTSAEYKIHFQVEKTHYEFIVDAVTGEVTEKTHPTPEPPKHEEEKPEVDKPVEPEKPVPPVGPEKDDIQPPEAPKNEEHTKPHEKEEGITPILPGPGEKEEGPHAEKEKDEKPAGPEDTKITISFDKANN